MGGAAKANASHLTTVMPGVLSGTRIMDCCACVGALGSVLPLQVGGEGLVGRAHWGKISARGAHHQHRTGKATGQQIVMIASWPAASHENGHAAAWVAGA